MRRLGMVLAAGLVVLAGSVIAPAAMARFRGMSREQALFQTTWKHGLHGWQTSDRSWEVRKGLLSFDAPRRSTILAPVRVSGPNFAVVARIRLVKYLGSGIYTANSFGVLFRASSSTADSRSPATGLGGGVFEIRSQNTTDSYSAAIVTTPADPFLMPGMQNNEDFNPGTRWHTYRIEVHGTHIVLTIDGQDAVDLTDKRFQSAHQVGLFCTASHIQVASFEVDAL